MKKIITKSEKETKEIGKNLARTLRPGIICLHGELGAGKTTLVKGIAEGLGIKENITSPTFALMNVYEILDLRFKNSDFKSMEAIANLVHIDTYRLKSEQELVDIGAEDFLEQPNTLAIIEWPEKIQNLLQNKKVVNIKIEHLKNSERQIKIY